MFDTINDRYYQLITRISELEKLLRESSDYELIYQNQGFLKKQFDLDLNRKKSNYKFSIIDLIDDIQKTRKQLQEHIREYFFYHHIPIKEKSAENIEFLLNAKFNITVQSRKSIIPIIRVKRYTEFKGQLNNNCEIDLKGVENKGTIIYTSGKSPEFYTNFSGIIFPNGCAEFKGQNIIDYAHLSHVMHYFGRVPDEFDMINKEGKFIIEAKLNGIGSYPYCVNNFHIQIDNIDKKRFFDNCKFLDKEFEEFKLQYPEVYK